MKKLIPVSVTLILFMQAIAQNNNVLNPAKLNITSIRKDSPAKLIIPGSSGPPLLQSQTLSVPQQIIEFKSEDGLLQGLAAIHDPHTKMDYILPKSDFYISGNSDITGCLVGNMKACWGGSIFKTPDSMGDLNATVSLFLEQFGEDKLSSIFKGAGSPMLSGKTRVSLRDAANMPFFTTHSAGGSFFGEATLTAIDVTDGILRLNMISDGGKYTGVFWIDLKAVKITRSTIDGQEMDLSKGTPYAEPLKKN